MWVLIGGDAFNNFSRVLIGILIGGDGQIPEDIHHKSIGQL